MKRLLSTSFLLLGLMGLTALQGVVFVVNYHAGTGQPELVSAETQLALPNGTEVRLGLLAEGFDPELSRQDLMGIHDAFTLLDTTFVEEVFGEPGRFAATLTDETNDVTGQQFYWWVLSTGDGSSVLPDYSNVTEWALFTSTESNWLAPDPTSLPPGNTVTLAASEVDVTVNGGIRSDALIVTVPEGRTVVLLGAAVLVLLVTGRRRS